MGLLKSLTRIASFFTKEILEVVRRPGALISLIFGPLIIMGIFGIGYSGVRRPLDTELVIPAQSGLSQEVGTYAPLVGPAIHVVGVTPDEQAARDRLAKQQIDLIVVAPQDVQKRFQAGQQSTITVVYNILDPVMANYADFVAYRIQEEVNHELITKAVGQGEQYALGQAGQAAGAIPPEVVASPTKATTMNIAESTPGVISFFGPAVFALILQHLAVTLTALSLIRERLSGVFEVFRISPVGALEILLGKYLALGVINLAIGGIVAAVLVTALHVPFLGGVGPFALTVGLLTFASLGLGLLFSVIADSERQAVQLSLLLLLASTFFSGFVLPVDEFIPAVRDLAYLLPVTHGIRLTQDFMLRGSTNAGWEIAALAGLGVAFFVLTYVLLRRSLRHV